MSLGPGPQYHPDELVFWNLLGSTDQVLNSAAGPNCTEQGSPTYEQGANWPDFGNAARIDANNESVTAYNVGGILSANAGCGECWIWPDGWTITNGAASAGLHEVWSMYDNIGGNQLFDFIYAGAGFQWRIQRAGVASGFVGAQTPPIMDSASQEWHHLAWTWDTTGIGGGPNTARVYWDGAEAISTNNAIVMPQYNPNTPMRIGLYDFNNQFFFDGRIDNFKWWDYAKTDFSDRFQEGFTPPIAPNVRTPNLFERRQPRVVIG